MLEGDIVSDSIQGKRAPRWIHKHLCREARVKGEIYLFHIDGVFRYVPHEYPAGGGPNKSKNFEAMYAQHSDCFIGCYDEKVIWKDLREDIEDFLYGS